MELISDHFFQELEKAQSLVNRFEYDSRNLIRRYVINEDPSALAFLEDKIKNKRAKQREVDDDVDHLDFGESLEVLQRHKQLPSFVLQDIDLLSGVTKDLVGVRNRANHVKVLDEGDLSYFLEIAEQLSEENFPNFTAQANSINRGTFKTTSLLQADNWTPILNNLIQPDYSETSLIGRKEDENAILQKLTKQNTQVVQIVGPAGTGKSALALKVLYKVLENDGMGFDCVLWCSLKTERLTLDGIEDISESISELFPLVSQLGAQFDGTFTGAISELGEVITTLGIKVLLCIDNLETTTGEEFGALVEALPADVKYLITSRHAVTINPYYLQPLKLSASVHLLRKLGDVLGVSLIAEMTNEELETTAERFGDPTLFLKLLCLGLQSGRSVAELETNLRSNFLEFAVKSAIETLGNEAKLILATLQKYAKPISFSELSLTSNLTTDQLNAALRELYVKSIAMQTQIGESQIWSPQNLTKEYLRSNTAFEPEILRQVDKGIRLLNDDSERTLRDQRSSPLSPMTPTAMDPANPSLRAAVRAFTTERNWPMALKHISDARLQSPSYYEVDRFEAWINRDEDQPKSKKLYLSALDAAPSDDAKSVVAYHFALSLLSWGNVYESLQYFEIALQVQKKYEVYLKYAVALTRDDQFEKALLPLGAAMDLSSTDVALRDVLTTKISNYRRWADQLILTKGSVSTAITQLSNGFATFRLMRKQGLVDSDVLDQGSRMMSSFGKLLRYISELGRDKDFVDDFPKLSHYTDEINTLFLSVAGPNRQEILEDLANAFRNSYFVQALLKTLQISELQKDTNTDWLHGKFTGSFEDNSGGYGFIQGENNERVYFRISDVRPLGYQITRADVGKLVDYAKNANPEKTNEVWFE